jgi:hypothetical protein
MNWRPADRIESCLSLKSGDDDVDVTNVDSAQKLHNRAIGDASRFWIRDSRYNEQGTSFLLSLPYRD